MHDTAAAGLGQRVSTGLERSRRPAAGAAWRQLHSGPYGRRTARALRPDATGTRITPPWPGPATLRGPAPSG
jgi:hypothetical protein